MFALQVSFLVLAWISVILRGYVRLFMLKHLSSDDYLMFASVVSVHLTGFRAGTRNIGYQTIQRLTPLFSARLYRIRMRSHLGHNRRWNRRAFVTTDT